MEVTVISQAFILQTLSANQERLGGEFGIIRIGLYCSFARNEQTNKSDIDLLYELREGRRLKWDEKEHFNRILRRKLDIVDYQHMNPFVSCYMRKDVIYVW